LAQVIAQGLLRTEASGSIGVRRVGAMALSARSTGSISSAAAPWPPRAVGQEDMIARLSSMGFQVVRQLKRTRRSEIFRIREGASTGGASYVAKVVSLHDMTKEDLEGLREEAALLKNLAEHPNVVTYREALLDGLDCALVVVMPFSEDGDLRHAIAELQADKWVLAEDVAQSWIRQMLAGLQHLHQQGIVHRDFNPDNVFLHAGRRCVRIGDIGMPHLLTRRVFERRASVGDGVYTSPELMRNEPCTCHADLWALGCVCFELCTLKLPFQAASPLDLALQVIENEPDWSLWKGFSEELRAAAARLLRKAAADRPSAEELLREPLFAEQSDTGQSRLEPKVAPAKGHQGSPSDDGRPPWVRPPPRTAVAARHAKPELPVLLASRLHHGSAEFGSPHCKQRVEAFKDGGGVRQAARGRGGDGNAEAPFSSKLQTPESVV